MKSPKKLPENPGGYAVFVTNSSGPHIGFFVKTKRVEKGGLASKCKSHGWKCNYITGIIDAWWMYMYTSRDRHKGMRRGETFKKGQECFKFLSFPELFPPGCLPLNWIHGAYQVRNLNQPPSESVLWNWMILYLYYPDLCTCVHPWRWPVFSSTLLTSWRARYSSLVLLDPSLEQIFALLLSLISSHLLSCLVSPSLLL